jgi:hypothetical protein
MPFTRATKVPAAESAKSCRTVGMFAAPNELRAFGQSKLVKW